MKMNSLILCNDGSMLTTEGFDAETLAQMRAQAEQGDAEMMANLGLLYWQGESVEANPEEGLKWFHKAAEAGNANAQMMLGQLYGEGNGVEKDQAKAAEWTRKAAEQGQPFAAEQLAEMYSVGLGVEKNAEESTRWMLRAAELGDSDGMLSVGEWYLEGSHGLPKDVSKAVPLLQGAAEAGDVVALYHLGRLVAAKAPEVVEKSEEVKAALRELVEELQDEEAAAVLKAIEASSQAE